MMNNHVISEDRIRQFIGQNYLNLETFRRSGVGVETPVWFVEQDGVLYVRTTARSGKLKRIRNNGRVRVVPCGMRGEPFGEWVEAQAELVDSTQAEKVNQLLKRKYGMQKTMFDVMGRLNRSDAATIAIHITS
jgi:uncharacterized protein